MITATCTGLDGHLVVTATIERNEIHLVARYDGQDQHTFRRSYEGTQEEIDIAALAHTQYYTDAILRAIDERVRRHYPPTTT